MKIPGDTQERTYLELLYEMYPELRLSTAPRSDVKKEAYASATNGGATPPHSLSLR